jgi:hypothetical protein
MRGSGTYQRSLAKSRLQPEAASRWERHTTPLMLGWEAHDIHNTAMLTAIFADTGCQHAWHAHRIMSFARVLSSFRSCVDKLTPPKPSDDVAGAGLANVLLVWICWIYPASEAVAAVYRLARRLKRERLRFLEAAGSVALMLEAAIVPYRFGKTTTTSLALQ